MILAHYNQITNYFGGIMKNLFVKFLFLSVVSISFLVFGCETLPPESQDTDTEILMKGDGCPTTYELNEEEETILLYMREEEKLARDIYKSFYNTYQLRIFNNIAKSEQTHMNSLNRLLNKYELDDPVGDNGIGEFTNPELQELYNTLLEQGNLSVEAALEVGGIIEEVDILDLTEGLENVDDNLDIIRVYTNLKRGSENHLRAFVKFLSSLGVEYEPHYLDLDTFNSIINHKKQRQNHQ